jgi:hypothetical protein
LSHPACGAIERSTRSSPALAHRAHAAGAGGVHRPCEASTCALRGEPDSALAVAAGRREPSDAEPVEGDNTPDEKPCQWHGGTESVAELRAETQGLARFAPWSTRNASSQGSVAQAVIDR